MHHQYWVYFVTNKSRTVLYIGVTNDIQRRLFEHRIGHDRTSFAWRYQCWRLVHLEEFADVRSAIARESQLKNWKRVWKDELIAAANPMYNDLSTEWDYSGWYDPKAPPAGYYVQHHKENWGGPEDG